MHIKDFTGTPVRLGEFPHCADVKNIDDHHSCYGVICSTYTYADTDGSRPRVMLIRSKDSYTIHLVALKWNDQFQSLRPEIKDGVVLFDSANVAGKDGDA